MVRDNQVHEPCVVAKAKIFLFFVADLEFAVVLDKHGTAQVERPQAVVDDVGLQDRAALTEKGLAKTFCSW